MTIESTPKLIPLSQDGEGLRASDPVTILYTNWSGSAAVRKIVPLSLEFGSNDWHPDPQWMVLARDAERNTERWFALSGISAWGAEAVDAATPTDGGRDEREAVARAISKARWPLASPAEQERWADIYWKEELHLADAAILARQQPPHAGGDAVREALDWPASYQETFDAIGKAVTIHSSTALGISVKDFYQALGYPDAPKGSPALATTPPAPGDDDIERCFICQKPFKRGDIVLPDENEGAGHAACFGPDREGYTLNGEPLKDGDPIPKGYAWEPRPAKTAPSEAITTARVEAAMDAFYPGENWRVDLGCALESSLRDMRAAIVAADATLATPGESDAGPGWRPIETAPKDGQPIDLFALAKYRLTDFYWDADQPLGGAWADRYDRALPPRDRRTLSPAQATHWMPLPAAPASSQGKGE